MEEIEVLERVFELEKGRRLEDYLKHVQAPGRETRLMRRFASCVSAE